MPWIPEEEIKRAREITAIEYLKKYQPNRLKKSSARNEWELTDHDSFKINELTSQWHWKSRDIGGTSALNFLIHVDGCSFLEAVQMLKDEYPTYIPPPVETKPKKLFVLPPASPDCRRVFRYLKERGISGEVLQQCVHLEILYESLPYHNAVFVGRDENQVARYAFLRGIYDASGKAFKMEQAGSEKAYAFCVPAQTGCRRVAVYEACVDVLAHMTLEQGSRDKYRLELGGINRNMAVSMARTLLNTMPQAKKDELVVQLINKNRDKLLQKGRALAAKNGVRLQLCDVAAKKI